MQPVSIHHSFRAPIAASELFRNYLLLVKGILDLSTRDIEVLEVFHRKRLEAERLTLPNPDQVAFHEDSIKEVATELGFTKTQMSAALSRLVTRGAIIDGGSHKRLAKQLVLPLSWYQSGGPVVFQWTFDIPSHEQTGI